MSRSNASLGSFPNNLVLFALGYLAVVLGHWAVVYQSGMPTPGGITLDITLTFALYALLVAVAGSVFIRTRGGWNTAQRRALSLRYAAISLAIDFVPAVIVTALSTPTESLSAIARGFRSEPLVVSVIVVIGMFVIALCLLIWLAIRDAIARVVLHIVDRVLSAPKAPVS